MQEHIFEECALHEVCCIFKDTSAFLCSGSHSRGDSIRHAFECHGVNEAILNMALDNERLKSIVKDLTNRIETLTKSE
jgi:hypothetical protein